MPIDIEKLHRIYATNLDSRENEAWITISDSKIGEIVSKSQGGSGGDFGNGWKIHISIDPARIAEAAILIAKILNQEDTLRVSIKFSGKALAASGQPSKQVALCFYEEALGDRIKIGALLNKIDASLNEQGIGHDPRPINSVARYISTKWDAPILEQSGAPSRFHYRNEDCVVLDDWLFEETAAELRQGVTEHYTVIKDNYILQDRGAQVKQSFFEAQKSQGLGHCPVQYSDLTVREQRHPNAKYFMDPFTTIRIEHQARLTSVKAQRPIKKEHSETIHEEESVTTAASRPIKKIHSQLSNSSIFSTNTAARNSPHQKPSSSSHDPVQRPPKKPDTLVTTSQTLKNIKDIYKNVQVALSEFDMSSVYRCKIERNESHEAYILVTDNTAKPVLEVKSQEAKIHRGLIKDRRLNNTQKATMILKSLGIPPDMPDELEVSKPDSKLGRAIIEIHESLKKNPTFQFKG